MKDLLMIDSVHETAIARHLQKRYQKQKIYTFLGPVLIAINPYKTLTKPHPNNMHKRVSCYDISMMEAFRAQEFHLSPPHSFSIAEAAYTNMMRFDKDQSLLITGESGSGKTETSKHVMQYIATTSTHMHNVNVYRRMSIEERTDMDSTVQHVTKVLWKSNIVLEAFGNAQTIRNTNSSRFGKYIVLQLNRNGQVIGGYIDHYLLEKNRVVHQAPNERNFHAFYQLLSGANEECRNEWNLLPVESYTCLTNDHDGVTQIQGVNDAEEYTKVVNNMDNIGISREEQHLIFQMIAAVLWIGEMEFDDVTDQAQNSCARLTESSGREAMEMVAKLLGLVQDDLIAMVSYRTLVIGKTEQKILFDTRQAKKVCDSLARCVYEKLFSWLVFRVNQSISPKDSKKYIKNCIGILDIYGFEIFQVNAFEQLCINYVNEKLQRLFLNQTLDVEQDEYIREGITWQSMEYSNNQKVCDLIEDPKIHGIFPLLDEQCAIARFSELELIERYNSAHADHPHYLKSKVQGPFFSILHYAGKVEYDVSMFFEVNMDTFFNDLHRGMSKSSLVFVHDLFHDTRSEEEKLKRPPSTSQQFRTQVELLITKLDTCHPHYIRCIKPNGTKTPMELDMEMVREQVRYLGLLENLTVRRRGFCYRQLYGAFLQRYKFLSKATWPHSRFHSARQATLALLTSGDIGVRDNTTRKLIPFEEDAETLGSFSLGKTKLFLKHPQALSALELLREKKLPKIVHIIEGAWKRYKKRLLIQQFLCVYAILEKLYQTLLRNCQERKMRRKEASQKDYVITLYRDWNLQNARFLKPENRFSQRLALEEREIAIIYAQSFVRAKIARTAYLRLRHAAIAITRRYRGHQTRKSLPLTLKMACKVALLGVRSEFERFLGMKKRRRDTLDREYLGDYIGLAKYPAYDALLKAKSDRPYRVLFASIVIKVNERFAHQERILVVTETHLFNLKAAQIQKPKERRAIDLSSLSSISLSPFSDNYVALHIENDVDLLLCVDQKTELVQCLREIVRKARTKELVIQFLDSFQVSLIRQKSIQIAFKSDNSLNQVIWQKTERNQMLVSVGNL